MNAEADVCGVTMGMPLGVRSLLPWGESLEVDRNIKFGDANQIYREAIAVMTIATSDQDKRGYYQN